MLQASLRLLQSLNFQLVLSITLLLGFCCSTFLWLRTSMTLQLCFRLCCCLRRMVWVFSLSVVSFEASFRQCSMANMQAECRQKNNLWSLCKPCFPLYGSLSSLGNSWEPDPQKHSAGPLSFLPTDVIVFRASLLSCCSRMVVSEKSWEPIAVKRTLTKAQRRTSLILSDKRHFLSHSSAHVHARVHVQ